MVSLSQTDKAYQSLREFLNSQIQDLHQTRTEIENEEGFYDEDNAKEVLTDLKEQINVNLHNTLPSYFQSQRNEIAQKLRNISVAVFNNLNSSEVALQIIKYALQFDINNLTKQHIENDYNQIAKIHKERRETEEHNSLVLKYNLIMRQLQDLINGVENDSNTKSLISKVKDIVNINDLNKFPGLFLFDDIRQQIALSIRALSVEIFNRHDDDGTAHTMIQIAQRINITDSETKQLIEKTALDIKEILVKRTKKAFDEVFANFNRYKF